MRFAIAWIATALVFVGLDSIWLSQVAPHLDPPLIGDLLANTVRPAPAIAFYMIYLTGIVLLAATPEERDIRRALVRGAILGFVAYGTYDLTNQATLRVWSTMITVADLMWGTFATAVAAGVGNLAGSKLRS